MNISFYGGAGEVTGANYLIEHKGTRILVDCGLHQGSKYAEDLNYAKFSYYPASVNYALVTHSHIDHVGRFPKLYKDGFRGEIFATEATADIMNFALPDNMEHITHEAEREGHEPLFNQKDLTGLLKQVRGVQYGQVIKLGNDIEVIFHDAGHVLGSAIIEIRWNNKKIFFSGDLGNPPTPLLKPTEFVHDADYLVIESAYGDRVHEEKEKRKERLAEIIKNTIKRQGVLMIPSFALERTQELLFELNDLHNKRAIPRVPIFMDSPLAIKLTGVYEKYNSYFNSHVEYLVGSGEDIFKFPGLTMSLTHEDSKKINDVKPPKVIIAGSGMSQGGRILHHEKRYLPDPNSAILFVGYQVEGSLGRAIQRGQKSVKIFGESVQVACHVESLSSYSAHADQPALLHWAREANQAKRLKKVFVVQGEQEASKTLADLIHSSLGVTAIVPAPQESHKLD